MTVQKPVIQDVGVTECDDTECTFYVDFDPIPDGVVATLYLKRFERKTWYLKDTSDTPGVSQFVASCVQKQWATDTSIRHVKVVFTNSSDPLDEAESDIETFICEPEPPPSTVPPTPVIRDLDTDHCDDTHCFFSVYFKPDPGDAEVELYLDGVKAVTGVVLESGDLYYVQISALKGAVVVLAIAYRSGVIRAFSQKVTFEVAAVGGIAKQLTPVGSSNLKGAGWVRWLESFRYQGDSASDKMKELNEDAVGTLLRQGDISEDEARARYSRMGYPADDVECLILLHS